MAITARQNLIKEIQLSLGGGMVDIEADPEHYDLAVTRAVDRYRQRAGNATEESFIFIDTTPNQDIYSLPPEVQLVYYAYRRGIGSSSAGGASIDPFGLAFTNNLYMVSNPSATGGGAGALATFDLAAGYQELAGRIFGREVIFTYNQNNHRLQFHRKFAGTETILLHVFNSKPEESIINGIYSKPWIRDYAIAMTKMFIGEAREKFSQIAGPQGGSTLNGAAMKSEALAELERLEQEVKTQIDGSVGYGFTIG